MDTCRNDQQQKPVASKPPQLLTSKYAPTKQPFKLRKLGFQDTQKPVCSATAMKSRRSTIASSVNSTIFALKGQEDSKSLSSNPTSNDKFIKNVCNALQPLKPKVLPNDLLEYEFAQYLDEELMCSFLEEDEKITRNILADAEVVQGIYSYFDARAVGITLARNSILCSKLNDIERLDHLLTSLTAISNLFTPDLNYTISALTSKLSDAVDILPISNCTFDMGNQEVWKNLGIIARKLYSCLCSEDKPFYFINLLGKSSEEARGQIESLEIFNKQKLSLQQSVTFLTSLRLSYLLVKKNEFQIRNGINDQSCESAVAEEELGTTLTLDNISVIYPDETL